MAFTNATVILDENREVYYAGQVINGKLVLNLKEPLEFSNINVVYHGEAKVSWIEEQTNKVGDVDEEVEINYLANEEYFHFVQYICGGQGIYSLPAGEHVIPFKYQIPPTVPSTYRGERGEVTYTITIYLEHSNAMIAREEIVKNIEVVAALDLNKSEEAKMPINVEFEEVYGSCSCESSPLNIQIQVPNSGFCPGQNIPISISYQNESRFEIPKIIMELLCAVRFHSQHPKSDYEIPKEVISKVKRGPFLSKSKGSTSCDLVVPDFVVPNLDNCDIIDLGYFLKMTVKLSGCNDDLEEESEITLGLVPWMDDKAYRHPMAQSLPNAPVPDPDIVIQNEQILTYSNAIKIQEVARPLPENPSPINQQIQPVSVNPQYQAAGCQTSQPAFNPYYQQANQYPGMPNQNNSPYPNPPYPVQPYPPSNGMPYPPMPSQPQSAFPPAAINPQSPQNLYSCPISLSLLVPSPK